MLGTVFLYNVQVRMIPTEQTGNIPPHPDGIKSRGEALPFHGARAAGLQQKKVVVVDDSRAMRSWLCQVISTDARLKVVGEASDALQARAIIKAVNPDVITLDINMPGMSGLEFLERLIALRPMPVVVVSSLTERGSDIAISALSLGAVDCIVKPGHVLDQKATRALTQRLFSAASSQVNGPPSLPVGPRRYDGPSALCRQQIVLIGASTGGVAALQTVLTGLDPDGAPVVIVQHMPGPFLESFVQRLNKMLPQDVALLKPGEQLDKGQVRVAPGDGGHSCVMVRNGGWQTKQVLAQARDIYAPSVDSLFASARDNARAVTAVLLTGLGQDGVQGLKTLHRAGAHTIGQDRSSSVVYGMPRAAFEIGALVEQLHIDDIAPAINRATRLHGNQGGTSQ